MGSKQHWIDAKYSWETKPKKRSVFIERQKISTPLKT